jgi:predicted Zn-dependent protease
MNKLAALNEILQLDPTNAFARYGLAMEHISQDNPEAALAEFDTLIAQSPDYVPAYQMSAQTLVKLSRTEAAIARLQAGLAAANRTANSHAASEMQALLDEISALPKSQ